MTTKRYFRSNLLIALQVAIEKQRAEEKKIGYTRDSGLVAGWVDLKEHLEDQSNEITLI